MTFIYNLRGHLRYKHNIIPIFSGEKLKTKKEHRMTIILNYSCSKNINLKKWSDIFSETIL